MHTILVNRSALKAVSICAANKDLRFYLNGVLLEVGPAEYRLVATDGHRLIVYRSESANDFSGEFIIPSDLIARIKGKSHSDVVTVTIDGTSVTINDNGTGYTGTLIDGKFPAYRRVFPDTTTGVAQQFNPKYLADFAKIAKEIGASDNGFFDIAYNGKDGNKGNGPALIRFGHECDYAAVLMPITLHGADYSTAWVKNDICQPEELAQAA